MTVKSKRIISIVLTLVLVAMLVPVAFAASSGSSWTAVDGDVTGDINDIVFGNNKFFAVTAGGERTSSTDGMTWLGSTYSNTAELYGLAYDGSSPPAHHYVHFGTIYTEEGEPESIGVWTSGGSSWSAGSVAGTDLALDANALLGGVAAGGGKMVAVGNLGLIIVSTDFGAHWSQPMDTNFATNSASLNGIVYGDNKFVAVGDLYNSKAKIITSADGTTWTSQTSAANSRLASIAYGNSTYVAVGDAGTIVTSTDGTNWTARTSNVSAQLKDVVFGNNGFVAVGSGGTILTSSNGTDWINRTNTGVTNKTLKAVAYGTGRGFVAGGEDGTLLISGLGVVYNGNGNNSGSVPTDLTFRLNGDPATVLGNTGNLEKTGFTFAGWNTKADGTGTDYAAAASLTIGSDDTILYAKWTANQGGGDNGGGDNGNSGEVAGVSLDATKYSLPVGGTHTTVLRTNASDNSSAALSSGVAFESSNTAVATVNASTGVVTAVAKGTVTISTYYSNGGTEYRRFATVTVDPKAPSYVEASDKKAGGIYLSVLDPSGAAVKGATVKIASGSKVYPLVTTDDNGRVLKYVPAGTYSVTVYAPNGTTLKNYTTKSLKVVAGQRSEPFAKQQLATGTVSFETNVIASADKTITGTAPTGTVVTARVGAATIGTAKADKTGKFTIKLKTAQPGKTVTVTAVDTEENEKTVALSVAKAPAVTLTAATKNNDAIHDIAITFKDTIGLLPTTVTSVTYNDTPLVKDTAYTIAKGKLTIKKGTFSTPGSYPLVVKSSAYEDASVTQTIVESTKK